ncbi:MAG TPA: DUF4258 domain-containing protein [Mariniphaga anaerophila]|mgnify:CR=1 FL=1|uniref:DUF4258 domain-containing protein n=1 Tax=Mariniphaga anaerophila TaxID=1484053 RepID=A0A831LKY7_9BACT|nr:DUF4258 domain-containing protein [Mariniphaga anaerophila]
MDILFSNHALERMKARKIFKERVITIIEQPDTIIPQDEKIRIYSKLINDENKLYLYRVFLKIEMKAMTVITVYRTSKIEKYGY